MKGHAREALRLAYVSDPREVYAHDRRLVLAFGTVFATMLGVLVGFLAIFALTLSGVGSNEYVAEAINFLFEIYALVLIGATLTGMSIVTKWFIAVIDDDPQ